MEPCPNKSNKWKHLLQKHRLFGENRINPSKRRRIKQKLFIKIQ